MVTVHRDRAVDFHLRSLGFLDRANLRIVSHDDKVYTHAGIVAKPDWVIFDRARMHLFIIDYKNRLAGSGGASLYESWQVSIFGYVTASDLARRANRPLTYAAGLLYANDVRLEVTADEADVETIVRSVPRAKRELARRGASEDKPIAASKLAKLICGEPMDDTHDKAAASEGTRAHATMLKFSPYQRPATA